MAQDDTCDGGGPRSRPHGARWGRICPPKKGTDPQFSADIYCGQTAVCIRIPLGTEVGLSLGDIVLDAVPLRKGHSSPLFLANLYCGHGRPSQLPQSSYEIWGIGRLWTDKS